ncbi:MAG: hypothetical protein C0506_05310 [Anaerolinea sp.]|nr:hypothetical protein [Anaerolinea sp.]
MSQTEATVVPFGAPKALTSGPLSRAVSFIALLARRKPMGFAGLLFIVLMVLVAAFPRVIATHDNPGATSVAPRFQSYCLGPRDTFLCPTVVERSALTGDRTVPGSLKQPFGTDSVGHDNYSRIVFGARWALYVGVGAVLISTTIALVVGLTSGYFLGKYDAAVQRVVDAVMALPTLVVLLALPAMIGKADLDGPLPFDEPSVTFFKLVVILGILGGAGGSRVIRASVISVRSAQYLDAARTIGATDGRIMLRHVLPNIFGALMVQATISLGGLILAEAALSFLGFGVVDPNKPTWGQMLNRAQQVASVHPWQAIWPGLFIALAVFSFNMLGDALRDLLDPRLRGARGGFG